MLLVTSPNIATTAFTWPAHEHPSLGPRHSIGGSSAPSLTAVTITGLEARCAPAQASGETPFVYDRKGCGKRTLSGAAI